METIFKKIANSEFDTLSIEEHKLINSYNDFNNKYTWTKQFWTYVNKYKEKFYWPESNTDKLFQWSSDTIDYYENNVRYIDIVEPIIVIFYYDIYTSNNRWGHMGKYVHFKKMSPESWKIKKSLFKEIIRDNFYNETGISIDVDQIKIYNIRVKDNLEYDSDDDGYGLYKKDIMPDIKSLNHTIPPKIPNF